MHQRRWGRRWISRGCIFRCRMACFFHCRRIMRGQRIRTNSCSRGQWRRLGRLHGCGPRDQMLQQVAADPDKPFFVDADFPSRIARRRLRSSSTICTIRRRSSSLRISPRGQGEARLSKGCDRPRNADLFIGRGASEFEAKQVIRAYLASISWADRNLGRVVAELERLKLRDNTVIVSWQTTDSVGENGKWSRRACSRAIRGSADHRHAGRERQWAGLHAHRAVDRSLPDDVRACRQSRPSMCWTSLAPLLGIRASRGRSRLQRME